MEEKQIQYIGESGKTDKCLIAISAILNSGCLPESVTVVTFEVQRGKTLVEHHLFLFWNWGGFSLTIVPDGFSSGYYGDGPTAFSLALCMIKSKQVPIYEYYTHNGDIFADIVENKIANVTDSIYQEIKNKGRKLTYLRDDWLIPEHKELLNRGQIWRKFYWRKPKTDLLTEAVANIDLHYPEVGRRLRMAIDKLKSKETMEWQSTGILIRDAWIELAQKLCQEKNIDTSDIEKDKVVERLKRLKIDEKVDNLAKSSFNLSTKHHDRNLDQSIAVACVVSTIMAMQAITKEVSNATG